ncbi:hypothetical protein HZA97_01115 [Candidatus Woesearchaeota archaeon]|nr:hypothetical protein [Candidatus Woesearchaeota archaeon]
MNNNILGDKKKSSFDDNLADIVNAKFDEEERLEKLRKEKADLIKKEEIKKSLERSTLSDLAFDFVVPERVEISINEWNDYFKETEEEHRLFLAGMPHYYELLKYIKNLEKDSRRKIEGYLMAQIYSIKDSIILLSSTSLRMRDGSSDTKKSIEADVGQVICLGGYSSKSCSLNYPHVIDMNITDYLEDNPERETFLQSLFQTQDDGEEITRVLGQLCSGQSNKIRVVLPSLLNSEVSYGCGFDYDERGLNIRCDLDKSKLKGYCGGVVLK